VQFFHAGSRLFTGRVDAFDAFRASYALCGMRSSPRHCQPPELHRLGHVHSADVLGTRADPDDDALLATVLAADAEMIVSGDAHLLNLKHYQGVAIVTTTECLRRLSTEPSEQK